MTKDEIEGLPGTPGITEISTHVLDDTTYAETDKSFASSGPALLELALLAHWHLQNHEKGSFRCEKKHTARHCSLVGWYYLRKVRPPNCVIKPISDGIGPTNSLSSEEDIKDEIELQNHWKQSFGWSYLLKYKKRKPVNCPNSVGIESANWLFSTMKTPIQKTSSDIASSTTRDTQNDTTLDITTYATPDSTIVTTIDQTRLGFDRSACCRLQSENMRCACVKTPFRPPCHSDDTTYLNTNETILSAALILMGWHLAIDYHLQIKTMTQKDDFQMNHWQHRKHARRLQCRRFGGSTYPDTANQFASLIPIPWGWHRLTDWKL